MEMDAAYSVSKTQCRYSKQNEARTESLVLGS